MGSQLCPFHHRTLSPLILGLGVTVPAPQRPYRGPGRLKHLGWFIRSPHPFTHSLLVGQSPALGQSRRCTELHRQRACPQGSLHSSG